jgi:hypothetical protein
MPRLPRICIFLTQTGLIIMSKILNLQTQIIVIIIIIINRYLFINVQVGLVLELMLSVRPLEHDHHGITFSFLGVHIPVNVFT